MDLLCYTKVTKNVKPIMLINRDELKAQMIRKHYSRVKMSKVLGVSLRSYQDKLNGVREFKESEIVKLVALFGNTIFFNYCLSVFRKERKEEEQ